jgi:EmrB/QacA subfamily drug resistance transporter
MSNETPMSPAQRKLLGVILVPLFMSLLSISIVNVVLPSLQVSIGASNSSLQWVLSGYTLAFGVLLVAAGRAGDLFGRGKLFVVGLVFFGVGSLAAGLAGSPLLLNLARIVMGLGSGMLSPQGVGMIQQYFHGKARGRAFGMFGTVVGVSVAIGPILGGSFIALFGGDWGWRLSFLANVPIAAAALIIGRYWLPGDAWSGEDQAGSIDDPAPKRRRADFDPIGVLLLSVGTLLVMLPFLERSLGAWMYSLLVIGAGLVVVWVWWETRYARRGGAPMVDMELFRTRSFASGALLSSVYFVGTPCVWVVVALYLQDGMHFSALTAGLIGLPSAAFSAIVPQITGRVVFTYGRKLVVWGVGVALLAVLGSIAVVLAVEAYGLSPWWLMASLAILGIAQGMVISPNQTLTLAEVPVKYAGSSGGVMQTGQRVGTAIGIAVITAVFFAGLSAGGYAVAFVMAFIGIGIVLVLTGIVGLTDLQLSRRSRARAQPA